MCIYIYIYIYIHILPCVVSSLESDSPPAELMQCPIGSLVLSYVPGAYLLQQGAHQTLPNICIRSHVNTRACARASTRTTTRQKPECQHSAREPPSRACKIPDPSVAGRPRDKPRARRSGTMMTGMAGPSRDGSFRGSKCGSLGG